jgi:lipid-binding SYLF domain-containing protein
MFLRRIAVGAVVAALLSAGPAFAQNKQDRQREDRRAHAAQTLDKLFTEVGSSKALYDKAVGYAVFAVTKAGFFVTGGGGTGVTINKATGETVYMKLGMGGVGFGFGGQRYDMVILFETADRLETFIDGGWDGRAAAKAVAGSEAASAGSGFIEGARVYTLGEKGLMASADISGTRFWVDDKLN